MKHLDGRLLVLQSNPGEVIAPKAGGGIAIRAVKGEGMPTKSNPFVKGNLFLMLSIAFPESQSSQLFLGRSEGEMALTKAVESLLDGEGGKKLALL